MKIFLICGKKNSSCEISILNIDLFYNTNIKKMTKKNIIIAILTFIIGFGSTFYIIRTYFPKHKVEKTVPAKDTLTNTKK